ncbi:M1 family metallopeptidase [Amniculibacterium sp. G2-70]|uniref:M1 family metallopeptidase n=1 Tax=Amniculibacterium sp. G2-70 TaxID=2767188 RepID=UPI0016542610|nr:M1 family metallopeptidase [Amniculibacterium sp. G2-70]
MKKGLALLLLSNLVLAQNLTKQDTLKGSNTAYRDFWDVKKYTISVEPNFEKKSLQGYNEISFEILKDTTTPTFQIDLQQPMDFRLVNDINDGFTVERTGDFIFIKSNKNYKKGEKGKLKIEFFGEPRIAKNAPWDGGWVFAQDSSGKPWMSVAQEGDGASLWLPIKDIWSDEPENGIQLKIITAEDLVGVGNGRLISTEKSNGKKAWTWEVKNPINAYSIVPTVGNLVNFKDHYLGEKGNLDLDYWVLAENLSKAKQQFQQVKPMLKALEFWFGPYPFYEDSYKIVETPYLGMEHQSNVAYGNHYENGYLGRDLSGTGVGLNWDFIIVHESGHEWFANNITAKDQADMWIHESFTSYSETLFTEKFMDKISADRYVQGTRRAILNDIPIIGAYGVRGKGSGDMYYKGANMLHTIRQVIGDDEKFRSILRGLNKDFYHQTVTTKQVEEYINAKSGMDFSSVFDQYLRTTKVPVLEYYFKKNKVYFRWQNTVEDFTMPLRFGDYTIVLLSDKWGKMKIKKNTQFEFNKNYYIHYKEVKGK